MLAPLRGRGRILPRPLDNLAPWLCMRCQMRFQHSAVAESPREIEESGVDIEPTHSSIQRSQQSRRHPPRQPRTYIARPQRNVALKSLEFMTANVDRQTFAENRSSHGKATVVRNFPLPQKDLQQVAKVFLFCSRES